MKNFYKLLPFLIFAYGAFNIFTLYTEHEEAYALVLGQKDSVDAQLIKIRKKVSFIKENEDKLKQYESKIVDVKKQMEDLKVKMPTESDQTAVLQELTNNAQELNLKDVNFFPVPKANRNLYIVNSVSLTGKGTYLQFLILFEKILSNKRFFNVSNFVLTELPGENKGRFTFVSVQADLETFEYNNDYKAPEVPPQT